MKYRFVFHGTREAFEAAAEAYSLNNAGEYLFEKDARGYRFGLSSGGHSGGYWFIPEYGEEDGELRIKGGIEFVPVPDAKPNRALEIAANIVLFPLFLISVLVRGAAWLVRKILRRPAPKDELAEKLVKLMTALGCEEAGK